MSRETSEPEPGNAAPAPTVPLLSYESAARRQRPRAGDSPATVVPPYFVGVMVGTFLMACLLAGPKQSEVICLAIGAGGVLAVVGSLVLLAAIAVRDWMHLNRGGMSARRFRVAFVTGLLYPASTAALLALPGLGPDRSKSGGLWVFIAALGLWPALASLWVVRQER